jgi:hypothetical protein
MQASPELLAWMRSFGFADDSVEVVKHLRFKGSPCLSNAQSNVAALHDVLHMSHAQVRCRLCIQVNSTHGEPVAWTSSVSADA